MDISRKKPAYPLTPDLREYLRDYDRAVALPVAYADLRRFSNSFPLIDRTGKDTLWQTIYFEGPEMQELSTALTEVYAQLKMAGDMSFTKHLVADRIDYCEFGNSQPFRVRIVNRINDNYDYFYVKQADASRLYGLELEHLLSPNSINFLVSGDTLIEEHIVGIPGDDFIAQHLSRPHLNQVRIAKEFVKFNERCFVRLLGDMRAYNYVIAVTPDFEDEQYRVRAIDFDQQSYEGRRSMYLPRSFKDNAPVVDMCAHLLKPDTVRQYQTEERALMAGRARAERHRLKALLDVMRAHDLAPLEKVAQLKAELNRYHHTQAFDACDSMGDLVRQHLWQMLGPSAKPAAG